MKTIKLTLSEEQYEWLEAEAERLDVTIQRLIRMIIVDAMEQGD